ncbi:unnamed protein product [Camellia sinensis]
MNDSRVNVGLACTAALAGAAVLNHAEVISFLKDEGCNRIIGAHIRGNLTPYPMICPSSGVHIVLPDYYSPKGMGLIVPKTKDGCVVFMLPWLGRTIAGTTDSSTTITMLPEPNEDEIEFILDAICDYLNVKVRPVDVLSAWSGIRPLATDPRAKNTESISRDHVVCEDYPGIVTITGGKWTTYRSMAEDAVDTTIKSGKLSPTNKCLTYNLRLIGGDGYDPASFTMLAQQYVRMKKSYNSKVVPRVMDTATAKHLSHAYGTLAEWVAAIAQNHWLTSVVVHIWGSQLAFLDTDAAGQALPRIIQILAAEHNWDKSRFVQMEHGCKEINKNLSICPLDFAEAFRLVITTMKVKMKTKITLVENTKITALKALAYQGQERLTRIYFPTPNNSVTLIIIRTFYVFVILQPGSARTSLIVTIGPSTRHHVETSSTIMFGQRAMKVVNVLKLKEEFDYESFCRKLENQVEHLTVEIDRQQKLRDNDRVEMEKNIRECQKSFAEAEKSLVTMSEVFSSKRECRLEIKTKGILDELKRLKDHNDFMHDEIERLEMSLKHSKKALADTTQMYEKKIAELMKQLEEQQARSESAEEQLDVMKKLLSDHQKSMQDP